MSKSKKSYGGWNYDDGDDYSTDSFHLRDKRKQKKMTNILRSKNVRELMKLEDDEDED